MIKEIFLKKIIEKQLSNLPEEQRDKILKAIEENPEFFGKISKEIQEEIGKGKDQFSCVIEIMNKYKNEIKNILGS